MTICERVGTFQTEIFHRGMFGESVYKSDLVVDWISCGYYSIKIQPLNSEFAGLSLAPEWIQLAPEWIQKVLDLYPLAERQPRDKLYKPFYEDFHTDASMIDMGRDKLFQAFKDQFKDRVILTTHVFIFGVLNKSPSVLYMEFEELKKFKEFLDNSFKPFYSGVRIGESGVEKVWAGTDCEPQQRNEW